MTTQSPGKDIMSTHRTNPATQLPLEVQHNIYRRLDLASFYAASKVCRWYRLAALERSILLEHRGMIHTYLVGEDSEFSVVDLYDLVVEAAEKQFLGAYQDTPPVRSTRRRRRLKAVSKAIRQRYCALQCTVDYLFDGQIHCAPPTISNEPRFSTWDGIFNVFGRRPNLEFPWSSSLFSLSSSGRLLAVYFSMTIRIYDLKTGLFCCRNAPQDPNIESDSGWPVACVKFEDNAHLICLKSSLSETVIYLGSPSRGNNKKEATLEHWKSDCGLTNLFLEPPRRHSKDVWDSRQGLWIKEWSQREWRRSPELIRRFEDGFLFIAERLLRGYDPQKIVGHIQYSDVGQNAIPQADLGTVTDLAQLDGCTNFEWEWLGEYPSEDEDDQFMSHRYALSDDGRVLACAEIGAPVDRPYCSLEITAYRIPSESKMRAILNEAKKRRSNPELSTNKLQDWCFDVNCNGKHSEYRLNQTVDPHARVTRWPVEICIRNNYQILQHFEVKRVACDYTKAYEFSVVTPAQTFTQRLLIP